MKTIKRLLPILLIILLWAAPGWGADHLIDSFYATPNPSGWAIGEYDRPEIGQSFTGDGTSLNYAIFYLRKILLPTKSITVYLKDYSGTWGSGVPGSTVYATSDVVDASTLDPSTFTAVRFNFTGANIYTPANGTHYFLTIAYGGDLANEVEMGREAVSSTPPPNGAKKNGSWAAWDHINLFYAYNIPSSNLSGLMVFLHKTFDKLVPGKAFAKVDR